MKNKITNRFLLFSMLATTIVIFFSTVMIYLIVSGKDADKENPKAITLVFSSYITRNSDGVFEINKEGRDLLDKKSGWLQLLDVNGKEVYSYNKPLFIKTKYKPYELIDDFLYSRMGYVNYVSNYENYTIFTGFSNKNLSKLVIDNSDNLGNTLLISGLMILIVGLITYIIMGRIFSKKITGPIDIIIQSIANLDRFDKNDQEIKHYGMFEKVFENLRALQGRLEQTKTREKEFENQRTEWIANISHDLKTPLSSISGYSEIMADQRYNLSSSEIIKYSEIIKKQTKYIENLISDLSLELKIKSMEEVLKLEKTNMNIFIKEQIILILNNCQYANRDISYEEIGELYYDLDKELFARALTNLLTNALKHSGEKARVKVILERISEGHGKISITDEGKGISSKVLERIFVRYYRGEDAVEFEGTGLGMSIAKSIIEAHGGKIRVDSIEGKGTTVTLYL